MQKKIWLRYLCFLFLSFSLHFITMFSLWLVALTERTETQFLLSRGSQPQGRRGAHTSYNRDMLKVVRKDELSQEGSWRASEK